MTTIVHYRGQIAYDSRVTAGNRIISDKTDKKRVVGGYTFWLSGCTSDWDNVIQAYLTGGKVISADVSAFCRKPDGTVVQLGLEEDGRVWEAVVERDDPEAIGSGSAHALTAVDCGCSVRDAVRMAIKRDSRSGGRIRVDTV